MMHSLNERKIKQHFQINETVLSMSLRSLSHTVLRINPVFKSKRNNNEARKTISYIKNEKANHDVKSIVYIFNARLSNNILHMIYQYIIHKHHNEGNTNIEFYDLGDKFCVTNLTMSDVIRISVAIMYRKIIKINEGSSLPKKIKNNCEKIFQTSIFQDDIIGIFQNKNIIDDLFKTQENYVGKDITFIQMYHNIVSMCVNNNLSNMISNPSVRVDELSSYINFYTINEDNIERLKDRIDKRNIKVSHDSYLSMIDEYDEYKVLKSIDESIINNDNKNIDYTNKNALFKITVSGGDNFDLGRHRIDDVDEAKRIVKNIANKFEKAEGTVTISYKTSYGYEDCGIDIYTRNIKAINFLKLLHIEKFLLAINYFFGVIDDQHCEQLLEQI